MRCCLFFSLAVLLLSPAPPRASAADAAAADDLAVNFDGAYLRGYGTDLGSIVTSPARWDARDWLTATAVAGGIALVYDNDAKIMRWVQDRRTTDSDRIGDQVTDLGHGKYTPVVIGGLYLWGAAADDAKARSTALLSLESFVLTGVFVQTLKYSIHRHRPNTGDPPHTFDGPSLHGTNANSSFPSGHASSAFAVASVLAAKYDNAVVPVLAYSVAGVTALNRAAHNAHWMSDVLAGSAIGYFTGKAIVASHRDKQQRIAVAPFVDDAGSGLLVTWRF